MGKVEVREGDAEGGVPKSAPKMVHDDDDERRTTPAVGSFAGQLRPSSTRPALRVRSLARLPTRPLTPAC